MIDIHVVFRVVAATLWVAVVCRYILDIVPLRGQTRGQRITQTGLGLALALLAFSTARAVWVDYPVSWLTYANPGCALLMVVGQYWDAVAARLRAHRP